MSGAEIGKIIFGLVVLGLIIGFVFWVKSAPRNEADDLLEYGDETSHKPTIAQKVMDGLNEPTEAKTSPSSEAPSIKSGQAGDFRELRREANRRSDDEDEAYKRRRGDENRSYEVDWMNNPANPLSPLNPLNPLSPFHSSVINPTFESVHAHPPSVDISPSPSHHSGHSDSPSSGGGYDSGSSSWSSYDSGSSSSSDSGSSSSSDSGGGGGGGSSGAD